MNHAMFKAFCAAAGLPEPQTEVRFAPPRRWRFDYLFGKVALEVEGGVWTGGRHNRAKGFLGDIQKYNAAALAGFVVLRCTPKDIETGAVIELLTKAKPLMGL